MRIQWRPRAVKDFDRLDARVQRRVATALERLAATKQGDVRKLTDTDPPEWRLRVGDWRVLFARDKAAGVLTVLRVLPRGKAYR
ncbi:MAG: type II toxin-antitoxin system RelE family toxin [Longimicrobiaceae bacterium]